jgi:hypothetical protein
METTATPVSESAVSSDATTVAGDVRIRRADSHNFVTERAVQYPDTITKKGVTEPHPHAGKLRWDVVGFYGENLRMASLQALREGMYGDSMQQLIDSLTRAENNVLKSIKGLK